MLKTKTHYADICVVGGGLAGMCAAIAAARHGSQVVLVQDRPVYGGNCSSEIRMWPLGAQGSNCRETGIFEEIVLENMRINPMRTYPIWDGVLYQAVAGTENLTDIMNCSVNAVEMDGATIKSISGWQLTTYSTHKIIADIFIDCSGDSIVGLLSGAQMLSGREGRETYGEKAAPEKGDSGTMGNSLMLQVRETNQDLRFISPIPVRKLSEEDLKNRGHELSDFRGSNWWWIELGGDKDCLSDAEEIKKDLLKLTYGVWDHMKNGGDHGADKWELDWVGYLPGKRESNRMIGDYILTQNDVADGTHFEDTIAYGGWKVDNHPPKGFDHQGEPTTYYPSQCPFEIPYRCLYSINIENLMFAGRNISVSHCALAAARVMGTCAVLGQAAGTAAHVAKCHGISPRQVGDHIKEVQKLLMEDDCWLPAYKREISSLCRSAMLKAACENAENLRNGFDRPIGEEDNGCFIPLGTDCTYEMEEPVYIDSVRIIFDSDLDRKTVRGGVDSVKDCPTICNRPFDMTPFEFPTTMTDSFELIADGEVLYHKEGNRQRLVTLKVGRKVKKLILRPLSTCGDPMAHVFSFDFK